MEFTVSSTDVLEQSPTYEDPSSTNITDRSPPYPQYEDLSRLIDKGSMSQSIYPMNSFRTEVEDGTVKSVMAFDESILNNFDPVPSPPGVGAGRVRPYEDGRNRVSDL
jgi:hypothetical protein